MARRIAWAAGLLAGALVLVAAAVPDLADLRGHPNRSPITALVARGVISGFPDGSFRPEEAVTRAQTAKLLVAALGQEHEALRAARVPSRFSDMGGHWATGYVEAAAELGLFVGNPDGTFRPDDPVTRVQAVVLLTRASGLQAKVRQAPPQRPLPFADAAAVPEWAEREVWAAADEGLLRGIFGVELLPERPANRAQVAALTARLLGRRGGLHHVVGIVRSWRPDTGALVLGLPSGAQVQHTLPRDIPTFRNGLPERTFRPLDQVWLVLDARGEPLYAEARYLDITGHTVTVQGDAVRFIERGTPVSRAISVAFNASIFLNGQPARLADLHGAQRIYLIMDEQTGEARVADAVRYNRHGTIVEVRPLDRTVRVLINGTFPATFRVALDASLFLDGKSVDLNGVPANLPAMLAETDGVVTYLEIDR